MNKDFRVCFRITEEERRYLEEIAREKGLSMSAFCRELVRFEFLKEMKK